MNASEKTASRIIISLAVLWVLGVLTGVVGFYYAWDRIPNLIDTIMSITLLAPFALPKSLGDIFGITNAFSIKGTLTMVIIYWPVVIILHWLVFKTNSYWIFLILGIMILVSNYNWINVGTSMIGL